MGKIFFLKKRWEKMIFIKECKLNNEIVDVLIINNKIVKIGKFDFQE